MSNNQTDEVMWEVIDERVHHELKEAIKNLTHVTSGLGFNKLHSTNDHMLMLEKTGQKSGTVVMAALQTKGRGRLKRPWYMKEGDIALSLLLRPPYIPNNLALLPLTIALALVDTIASLGLRVWCKWPNDIVIENVLEKPTNYFGHYRKIAGILVENVFADDLVSASIIGIGINLTLKDELKATVPHLGSLSDYLPSVCRASCLKHLLSALDQAIISFTKPSPEKILRRYQENCATLGREVMISSPHQLIGYACAIHDDGSLIIDDGQKLHRIFAGDVNLALK
jgi:BirA family biotin operon repressor/biotin-[acetyl-CoA-carboxylase] ligase